MLFSLIPMQNRFLPAKSGDCLSKCGYVYEQIRINKNVYYYFFKYSQQRISLLEKIVATNRKKY